MQNKESKETSLEKETVLFNKIKSLEGYDLCAISKINFLSIEDLLSL
jgi:hypothetical protein